MKAVGTESKGTNKNAVMPNGISFVFPNNHSFSAGGCRTSSGEFTSLGNDGFWWLNGAPFDEVNALPFAVLSKSFPSMKVANMSSGFSIRCIKN